MGNHEKFVYGKTVYRIINGYEVTDEEWSAYITGTKPPEGIITPDDYDGKEPYLDWLNK